MTEVHQIAHRLALRASEAGIQSVEDALAWIKSECMDWQEQIGSYDLEKVALALYRQCNPLASASTNT